MGFIYKVTNHVNGKMYIGQTKRKISVRWSEHIYDAKNNDNRYSSILHNAMVKYGTDAFVVEEIESCDNSVLDDREMYWIKFYNTHIDGYNIRAIVKNIPDILTEHSVELWNKGHNLKEIGEILNVKPKCVSRRLKAQGITQEQINKRSRKNTRYVRGVPAYQYNISGEYLRGYSSIQEVRDEFGTFEFRPDKNVTYAHGYYWSKEKVDKIVPFKTNMKHTTYQYTIDGEYVRSYETATIAARSFGAKEASCIRSACTGRHIIAYGYRWSYEKMDSLPPLEKIRKYKKAI